MTNEIGNEIWKYSKKAMNRYGRGSAVGLDLGFALFVVSLGGFVLLLHAAGVIR
jgi:hypothetical protein